MKAATFTRSTIESALAVVCGSVPTASMQAWQFDKLARAGLRAPASPPLLRGNSLSEGGGLLGLRWCLFRLSFECAPHPLLRSLSGLFVTGGDIQHHLPGRGALNAFSHGNQFFRTLPPMLRLVKEF